ncbi:MAG: 16S rRNA (adenine(1518)-N(6)/adenine(1519)-N(6))-dimethyltransferase RsmA, partial [candidate division Zixibacteria bacterium]
LAKLDTRIIAVEFDRDLIGYLTKLTRSYGNVTIVHQDFLTFVPPDGEFALVGNLPYNLTTPVIDYCLKYRKQLSQAVLMVQDEMAARLAASPGEKGWSPVSVFTQLCFSVERAFSVPPTAFRPVPKVNSAVIQLLPLESEIEAKDALFEKVVRAAFGQRRKLLTNNLITSLDLKAEIARSVIADSGLPDDIRAEQMSIEKFLELTKHLKAHTIV